jgi:formamidopyrimidine-DNA glycosylase
MQPLKKDILNVPELPEVETVMRGLEKEMLGETLHHVSVYAPKLRWEIPISLKTLKDEKIIKFSRRSKYVLMELESAKVILIHLGMSGKILFSEVKSYIKQKHDHVLFYFGNGHVAVYNDARRFGMVDVLEKGDVQDSFYLKNLGPEPLGDCFTKDYFYNTLQKSRVAIKVAIMQQKVVVGVGNIYASESLYAAKIHPKTPAHNLTRAQADELHTCIIQVLKNAIAAGGSTLKDYVQADGALGYFQHSFKVYGRENEPCYHCKDEIKKIVLGQRSTFFCGKCQIQ